MSAFLTSLASIGANYGEAKDESRKEEFTRAEKIKQDSATQTYLDLAKQAEARQAAEFEQRKKAGDLIQMKDGRIWSVSKGGFIDQHKPDLAQVFKKFFSTLDPRIQKILGPKAQVIAEEYPYDLEEMLKAMLTEADKAQSDVERQDAAALAETNRKQDKLDAEKVHEKDVTSENAWHERFAKMITNYRGQGLTPAAEKILMTTQPTIEQVDRLLGDIKKLGLENNNQNGYLFRQRLKYAMGQASPEGTLADDIAGLSLGSVIEAGSAMQGMGRSLTLFKKAAEHTPNAWIDSPMLIAHKLKELRTRLRAMEDDAQKYGTKRGLVNIDPNNPAGQSIDPAVQLYLQSVGVK